MPIPAKQRLVEFEGDIRFGYFDRVLQFAEELNDCPETMSPEACEALGLPRGSTYARGSRRALEALRA